MTDKFPLAPSDSHSSVSAFIAALRSLFLYRNCSRKSAISYIFIYLTTPLVHNNRKVSFGDIFLLITSGV